MDENYQGMCNVSIIINSVFSIALIRNGTFKSKSILGQFIWVVHGLGVSVLSTTCARTKVSPRVLY